ncbi:hypothetical protein HOV30_gp156 [Erwinia phage Derbicus]|uniref:Uncharacterized protein n=2 Tax=Derbicusvirus derbicus TaxID=2734104 RepID=A0A482IGX9_9CAUD|nr:hypothetical protein BIZ82_gp156 [Erwinia phage vB_EamM_EarlPhillipIV]YP_009821200.1 hypothetical protein HOV30_gp156 [Erwinia phage Derbicus]ANZ49005.1 hypothetical protein EARLPHILLIPIV_156 [Erwinia phage vB_EamM_EarlPhillipIV]QBP07582.1 hypothetical protein DERBICUS_156 [Erwinia phage Derbicus]
MQSLMIHNFTRLDTTLLDAFLTKHKLFDVSILCKAENYTDTVKKLVIRHSLNVHIELDCVENGHNSLANAELRNAGLEQRMLDTPPSKLTVLFRAKRNKQVDSLIALAQSFPNNKIKVVRDNKDQCNYFELWDHIGVFNTAEETPVESRVSNLVWQYDLAKDYSFLDYGLLKDVGILGKTECLVMTK